MTKCLFNVLHLRKVQKSSEAWPQKKEHVLGVENKLIGPHFQKW